MTISIMNRPSISPTLAGVPSESIAHELENDVKTVCSLLPSDPDAFQQGVEALYTKGRELILAEMNNAPLTKASFASVIKTLHQHIEWDKIPYQDTLYKTVLKTYQIFLDLTWYRAVLERRHETLDCAETVLSKISTQIETLPQVSHATAFVYNCCKEALNYLHPTDSMLLRHQDKVIKTLNSTPSNTFLEMIKHFKTISDDTGNDWINSWYLTIQPMLWRALTIQSASDFNQIVTPLQPELIEEGHSSTLGLVNLYTNLIQKPHLSNDVKQLAINGLTELASLTDPNLPSSVIPRMDRNTSQARLAQLIKEKDRYYQTKEFIKQSLRELKTGGNIDGLNFTDCLNALKDSHIETLASIQKISCNLSQEKKDNKAFINELEQRLEPTRGEYITKKENDGSFTLLEDATAFQEVLEVKPEGEVQQRFEQIIQAMHELNQQEPIEDLEALLS
ncbi:hypothetical protein [Rhabdochlamydiaceae symbiont of Dictyostelium giganteum]|uniref:hypothetical protein n=1 Tax=Rhabdochlamydiaceae symbiont of Dictyostelium giganteum TaxID=3342349 RepID=UPI00384FB8A3